MYDEDEEILANLRLAYRKLSERRLILTQKQKVLFHLANGKHLTRQDAMMNLGIMNITARIAELRRHHLVSGGIEIESFTGVHPTTGAKYTRYQLPEAEKLHLVRMGVLENKDGVYYPQHTV